MEKLSRTLQSKKKKQKLPTLPHNKSHMQLNTKANLPTSPTHLKDLRKLYYQYKSNANILAHSPYYTNRQCQHNVVNYIQAHKHQPTPEQLRDIDDRFVVDAQMEQRIKDTPFQTLAIRLHLFRIVLQLRLQARTIEQLEILLKKQFAVQEVKSYGCLKRVDSIGGFSTLHSNSKLDFLLSHKNFVLPSGKYQLQPWLFQNLHGKVEFKHFQLIRCLGSGGFSLVYLARDKLKGNFHALKLIDKAFILQSQRQMIVENERYVLGELKSPFITPLRFCFETKQHFAFAIQYCPGGELFYQLKKVKRMTENQARFYFLEILIGLDHIHKQGIVYRDLKPQNLLIGQDGHIRIADFGLAKPLLGRPAAYSFCGSPQYMAPQMLLKTGHRYTLDYYCLGALLYELVIGVPPYYSLNHQQIHHSVLNEELTFPTHTFLSDEIKSILLGLLEKNPSKRLGSMHGLKEIIIHPWVGRVPRKDIQEKKMVPPFLPDLSNFNFDQSELGDRTKETGPKIAEDMRCQGFETHFNRQFYFADPGFLPLTSKGQKTVRSHLMKSLEKVKRGKSNCFTRRAASQRGKSK